jgi:hypothetical protein
VVTIPNLSKTGIFIELPFTGCVVFEHDSVCIGWALFFLVDVVLAFIAAVMTFVSRSEIDRSFMVGGESFMVSACFSQLI